MMDSQREKETNALGNFKHSGTVIYTYI